MVRSAVAYLANDRLIIAPIVRTTTGLGLEVGPTTFQLPLRIEAVEVTLRDALAASAKVVPHPDQSEWKGFFKPFQSAANVRSYKAFMAVAQSVSIRDLDDTLKLTPQRNLGAKDGFEPISSEAVLLRRDNLAEAAATMLRLLGLNGS